MTVVTDPLRDVLVRALEGEAAHMSLEDAVTGFPLEHINTKPPNTAYSFWHILEHIRITQFDILDYVRNPDYKEPKWPDAYWPVQSAFATKYDWEQTIARIERDNAELIALVRNPKLNLTAPLQHLKDVTLVQEVQLVIAHTSYHIGEFAILRQVMNIWPPDHT